MDKRTVFLDGVENARALSLVGNGVLVGQPPELWFYRDTDGDGIADDKQRISDEYGPLATNHSQPSGLIGAMDNWIYSTRFISRVRWRQGEWQLDQPISARGQWGLSQDNAGAGNGRTASLATQPALLRKLLAQPDEQLRSRLRHSWPRSRWNR
jgi:hypothetical protein